MAAPFASMRKVPPSATRTAPVSKYESSLARKLQIAAILSGVTMRRRGNTKSLFFRFKSVGDFVLCVKDPKIQAAISV